MKNLNELAKEIHAGNVARGFYEVQPTLKTQLMRVITKLSKAVEADIKGRYVHDLFVNTEMTLKAFEEHIKDTFEDEIADAFIRLLDIAGYHVIPLHEYPDYYRKINTNQCVCDIIFDICSTINSNGHIYEIIWKVIDDIKELCKSKNIDLNFHVTEKLRYNATGEYKHGKKY